MDVLIHLGEEEFEQESEEPSVAPSEVPLVPIIVTVLAILLLILLLIDLSCYKLNYKGCIPLGPVYNCIIPKDM